MRQIKINETLGTEIISVVDCKNFIRIDTNADDSLLELMIESARINAENYLSRDIVAKNRTYFVDEYKYGTIDIPFGPVDEIISVVNQNNTSLNYVEFGLGDKMIELNMPALAVSITYTTLGMNDGLLKQALLMIVSSYYDNRADFVVGSIVQDIPSSSKSILGGYKSVFV